MNQTGPDPTGIDQPGRPPRAPIFTQGPSPVVLALAAAILLVQTLVWWSTVYGEGFMHGVAIWLGAVRTGTMTGQIPPAPVAGLSPYLLHVFVHFGWFHTLLNVGALIAFGAAAARPFGGGFKGGLGFLAFFFVCGIAGAALSKAVHWSEPSIMVGASTAISGILAAAGWAYGGRAGMLRIALPWLGINVALAVADPFFNHPIAWAGHLGGLVAGMALYPLFVQAFRRR
ncbi:MAG: rhomboid family intramembrane serine protease [Oceanicaulis sp.]